MAKSIAKKAAPAPVPTLPEKTKLGKILEERGMQQIDLIAMIEEKFNGRRIGNDRISRMCKGKQNKATIEVYVMIAHILNVPLDDIIEKEKILEDLLED